MRQTTLLTFALLFVLAGLPAHADKIFLKDGRVIEGTVLTRTEEEVKIDIKKHGAALTFKMSEVDHIDRTAGSPEELYEGRLLLTDRKNPDSLVGLADWCAKNALEKKAVEHYKEALEIQADHPRARGRLQEMGYRDVDGKWLSKEEQDKLANPPAPLAKPPEPKGPTSEDVAKEQGPCIVVCWSKEGAGLGAWSTADGQLWVSGKAAQATQGLEVDYDGKKLPARIVVRDRLRQVALWKVDGVHVKAAHPSVTKLPEKEPLVALTPTGVLGNVFARGWDRPLPEVWTVRLEGVQTGAAIFNLAGELVGLSGDGKSAVPGLDLLRLQKVMAPSPEGEGNAAGSYWRATDLAEGPALEMIRAGSKFETFEPGLGPDDMNRGAALARDLARLGKKLDGGIEDHIAALHLVRHLARAKRIEFTLAAADVLDAQAKSIYESLSSMSPAEIQRLRAAVEGLGPDPAGIEAAATGEATRLEDITIGAKEAKALLDMQISGFPILGPEPIESLEGGVKAMYDLVHQAQEFASKVRAACSRPDEARRADFATIGAGPGPFSEFATLKARAMSAMTSQTAIRIAIRVREMRATSGSYPEEGPTGLDDPATGKPFEYKREGRGFVLTSPGGVVFRIRE